MKKYKNQEIIKRLIDISISLIILVIFIPIWIIIAIIIKITSKGPILFLQERPGRYRKIFRIYKFRTMKQGSEKMIKGIEVMNTDERITIIGKYLRRTKIDELPQILNVLRGEMSLVGPRPERISSLENYDDEISKRLNFRPGMTGLAQVNGNIYLDLKERYKYDLFYINNYSLYLDLKIIIKTIVVIIFGEHIFAAKNYKNPQK